MQRQSYSFRDERLMWSYLYDQLYAENLDALAPKGNRLWRSFEETGATDKTAASLTTHFRRYMIDHIDEARLPIEKILYIAHRLKLCLSGRQRRRLEHSHDAQIVLTPNGIVSSYKTKGGEHLFPVDTDNEGDDGDAEESDGPGPSSRKKVRKNNEVALREPEDASDDSASSGRVLESDPGLGGSGEPESVIIDGTGTGGENDETADQVCSTEGTAIADGDLEASSVVPGLKHESGLLMYGLEKESCTSEELEKEPDLPEGIEGDPVSLSPDAQRLTCSSFSASSAPVGGDLCETVDDLGRAEENEAGNETWSNSSVLEDTVIERKTAKVSSAEESYQLEMEKLKKALLNQPKYCKIDKLIADAQLEHAYNEAKSRGISIMEYIGQFVHK